MTWLKISLFCLLFSAVYEYFSFGVYSVWMIGLFVWPLVLGAGASLLLGKDPGRLWNDGVLVLTAGSLLKGIHEIYGTTNVLTGWFLLAGAVLLSSGVLREMMKQKAQLK